MKNNQDAPKIRTSQPSNGGPQPSEPGGANSGSRGNGSKIGNKIQPAPIPSTERPSQTLPPIQTKREDPNKVGVTSYDPTSNVKRPESGKTKTIHQNQAISGIKQVHPTAVKPDLNTEGPLNSTGQFTIGALENSSLLGPAASNPLKINMNLVGESKSPNRVVIAAPASNNYPKQQQANPNKIAPMPQDNPQDKKQYGAAKGGRQKHVVDTLSDEEEEYMTRKAPQSLRSSFDYLDVNLNDAMKVAGNATLTGRGSKFLQKQFKEDNWSADESVYNKQMKMPNVNANKIDYQNQIGLNLDMPREVVHQHNIVSQPNDDPLQEARDLLPPSPFYKIVKKDRIQIIDDYSDRCPFLEARKTIMRWRVYINRAASLVVMTTMFETLSISVIIINSMFLAMDDPLRDPSETPTYMTTADNLFQYCYTVEAVFKVVSLGFIFNKGSYLRDSWNILDFVIISSGYVGMILAGSGVNLSVLRSFRVIRPLRTISSIQGLKVIVQSLMNAIPLLRDSLLVLMFFFLVFAIAGVQLFSGALKNNCFNEDTGIMDPTFTEFCGGQNICRPTYFCGKSNNNPADGSVNFDNVMFSMFQVFTIVTLEGWTSIMNACQQTVGSWTFIYFYPIVFIGAWFLLNLTLAVIKAKFSEEMASKKEAMAPKAKRLNDAALSSEDEDMRPNQLQDQINEIRDAHDKSPRSKDNLINKLKIEHMLWKLDVAFERRDVEHKIVEKNHEELMAAKSQSGFFKKKSQIAQRFANADKISILQPGPKALSYAAPKFQSKAQPQMNYSEVFYSNKSNIFLAARSPRENLRDIFQGTAQVSTNKKQSRVESPIREDEEEHDLTGLLDGQEERDRQNKRRTTNNRLGSGGRNANQNNDLEGPLSLTIPNQSNKAVNGVSKWLGKVFEVNQRHSPGGKDGPDNKKLVFAGMNSTNKRQLGVGTGSKMPSMHNQEQDERMKKAVYENITRNFDIFEFLDDNDQHRKDAKPQAAADGDDEMSDELEFQIDDNDNNMESMFFDTEQMNRRAQLRADTQGILDLDDNDEEEGTSRASEGQPRLLKRGSTQATAAENRAAGKQASEKDNKYTSPYGGVIQRKASPKNSLREKRARVAERVAKMPEVVYKGRENGFMRLFRACKQIKAKREGRDYKEEYLLLKKRAKSSGPEKKSGQAETLGEDQYSKDNDDNKSMTVRAKSIENKKKRLLAESIKFITRINIMKKRRTQYFAPGIKQLDVDREDLVKEYDDYVFRKRKIKIDPDLIVESKLRKVMLYRTASADAIMRRSDAAKIKFMNAGKRANGLAQSGFDQESRRNSVESQRSLYLDEDYERFVSGYNRKEQDIEREVKQEEIPPMDKILQDQHLKVVVKMTAPKYTSIHDIFEKSAPGRFLTDKERERLVKQQKHDDFIRSKLPKRVMPRDLIIGFQKKIFVDQKQFHEELMKNEFSASDEDQDGMMDRIEGEYNYDHRSHIFVTGTISVVVNKPHHDNKIMNANYHATIKELANQEELIKNPPKVSIIQYDDDRPNAQGGGSMWNNIDVSQNATASMLKLRNASKFSMSLKGKSKMSSMGESMVGSKVGVKGMPPKPEPLNDKQILKRLNDEVKKSRIFQALNFKRLPDSIVRKQELDKNLFKKKKKKGLALKQEEDVFGGDDEGDESEGDTLKVKQRKIDYFLDRPVDGNFQIGLASGSAFKRHKDHIEWSGQDIMARFDPYKARLAVDRLNSIRVWPYSAHGLFKRCRVLLKAFMNSKTVEYGILTTVIFNTAVLSMDSFNASDAISNFCLTANLCCTMIFTVEMGLRQMAIGMKKWLANGANWMDGIIVILSLVELIFMSGSGAGGAMKAVRIFRVFRVLRIIRLLRSLKSMVQIINVMSRSIMSFMYLGMLILLFVFIYALLGMSFFGGQFTDPGTVGTVRYNFDNFNQAFITSFVLLTVENWNQTMMYAYSSTVSQAIIAVYFVSAVFIGNWMLLNLFLAILLDSFTAVEEEDKITPEKKEASKQKMLEDLKIKQGEDFIEGMDELQKEGFALKSDKTKKKKKKSQKDKASKSNMSKVIVPVNNILEESAEVDLEGLAIRQDEELELRKVLFRGVEAKKALYLFSKTNWIRIKAYQTINHPYFETLIMTFIIASSSKLVFDTFLDSLPSSLIVFSERFDLTMQIAFTIEMSLKLIAIGFVMDEGSYLLDPWNKLDGFIVVSGLLDIALTNIDLPIIKIFKLLRIMRVLRFVSHSQSMRQLIEALMASMGSIANVSVVIIIVFMMFAILGVNLFSGKLFYCANVDNPYFISNAQECYVARGQWVTTNQGMDNVMLAMLTLFIVSNNEGWPDVMYAFADATGVETGPKPGYGVYNCYFFVLFVAVGSFFFLNLFVGVLFLSFEKAQSDEKEAMLLDANEVRWTDMMKMIVNENPEIVKIPKGNIRKYFFDLTRDEGPFANFIMACIILNIIVMAATFDGQSDKYSELLQYINYFFSACFTLEATCKLIAHNCAYFNTGWNKFDFFVVSASFLDIIMAQMSASSLKAIKVGPQLARIMRVMRVTRLFKLLNKYKGLQALLQTIKFSVGSMMNAFALLSLVLFIFSVLGVFFFKNITGGLVIGNQMNFTTFSQALMMMVRMATGENWPQIMWDTMNTSPTCVVGSTCGSSYNFIFFIGFVVIMQYIMINLFILIILQQFDLYYLPNDNVLDRFAKDVKDFKATWKFYAKDFDGMKIRGLDIQKFFKDLKGDLGMSAEKDKKAVERNLVIMNILADPDGYIYFNELLYKTMKRRYANGRTKKKVLFELELQTLDKLKMIMEKDMIVSRIKERSKAASVNPFLAMMYKNMSFNAWEAQYIQNTNKRREHFEIGLEKPISDDEEEQEEDVYEYQTEEEDIIDELDQEYLDKLAEEEAVRADPLGEKKDAVNNFKSRISDSKQYDQLSQEEEVLAHKFTLKRH